MLMGEGSNLPEFIPPQNQIASVPVLRWRVTPKIASALKIGAAVPLLGVAGWLLQNFLQLRGVVNLLASRIDLVLLAIFLFGGACVLTIGMQRRRVWRVVAFIVIALAAAGIDLWAPKPLIQSGSSLPTRTTPPTAVGSRERDVEKQLAPEQLTSKDKVQAKVNKAESGERTKKPTRSLPPSTSSRETNWLSALKNPPTMSDVFTNDFPNTMKLSDEAIGIEWKDNGTTIQIKRQLYLDFPANSKFVGFYVPTSDPSDISRTAEACLKLAQVDAVQQALDELPKKTFIAAGLGQTTTIQDLTFSGRVVIYHDDFLSITQQADIIRAFAAKHYAVGFFGPNDFGKTLSSWHHLHDAVAVPSPELVAPSKSAKAKQGRGYLAPDDAISEIRHTGGANTA
jgi:hypothetical protein